jgi:hypothetical protein
LTERTDVAEAEVVGHDVDDVGLRTGGGCCRGGEEERQDEGQQQRRGDRRDPKVMVHGVAGGLTKTGDRRRFKES